MKSLPIALSGLLLITLCAWIPAANAGVPIEVSAPAGDDPPNQVLEIPQSCSSEDGTENPCPRKDSTTASGDPSSPDASAPDASGTAAPDDSIAEAPAASPDADGSLAAAPVPSLESAKASADLGTAQDYQDQAQVDNTAALPNYGYPQTDPSLRMPTILVAPVAIGPIVGTAPYVAPILPAAGPILMPRAMLMSRPPMIYVVRPAAPMVMSRPMSGMGVPHAFRVH